MTDSDPSLEPIVGERTRDVQRCFWLLGASWLPAVVAVSSGKWCRDEGIPLTHDRLACAGPKLTISRPLPRVLIIHTGGTLGEWQMPNICA